MKVLIYNILLSKGILNCCEKQVSNIVLFYMMEKVFNVLFYGQSLGLTQFKKLGILQGWGDQKATSNFHCLSLSVGMRRLDDGFVYVVNR